MKNINRYGFITGIILAGLGILYIVLLGILASTGAFLPPPPAFQFLFSAFTLVTSAIMVFFWSILHVAAPVEKKLFTLTSLAFTIIFTSLTSINRFVAMTVVPQSIALGRTEGLEWFLPYEWPSIMLAIEILAWGFFFGLACLSLAPFFSSGRLNAAIRWALIVTGVFALCSALGQIVGSFVLSVMGPIAWGPGLAVVVLLISIWFRRRSTTE